jgi:hypothetical protein
MSELTRKLKAVLRQEWSGPRSVAQLVTRYHVGRATILQFWADEREARRLPETARPHFAVHSPLPPPAPPPSYEIDAEIERDFARCERTEIIIPDPDPLLAALRRHHGADARRHSDDVTRDDRKLLPARGTLLAMAVGRDAFCRSSTASLRLVGKTSAARRDMSTLP